MARSHKRTSRRRSSQRRRPKKNPLSTKKKVLLSGMGVVVVGGITAYMLLKPGSASASDLPPGGGLPPGPGDKAAECAALQAGLIELRKQPTPDPGQAQQLEAQIAACIAQLQEQGGAVDPWMAQMSAGDALYAKVETWLTEYRTTDYSDLLRRNNIRQEMLRAGQAMAAAYAAAVTASTNSDMTLAVRLSIVRALDAALLRRLCYLYDQRGCGRAADNEAHGNDKAADVQTRVIRPLLAAYTAAVDKLGGPGAVGMAPGSAAFVDAFITSAAVSKERVDTKFAEYKSVDYSDVVRRNNLRQEVLTGAREMVAALQQASTAAVAYQYVTGLATMGVLILAALDAATTRWLCYVFGASGCGRFAANEDSGDAKGAQEQAASIAPLSDLYMQAGGALVIAGADPTAFDPFIAGKLRVCSTLNDHVNAKFAEYKRVSYSDAVRRNNLRQEVLTFGRLLTERLQDAQAGALASAQVRPSAPQTRVLAVPRLQVTAAQRAAALVKVPSGAAAAPRLAITASESQDLLRRLTGR